MFTLRPRSSVLSYRTSLPVVQEDIRDYNDSDLNAESPSVSYRPFSGPEDNLQLTLDICLDHLENIQLTDSSARTSEIVTAADGLIPAANPTGRYVTGLTPASTTTDVSVKPDSGFWSQSFDSYRISMAALDDSTDVDLDAILGELCALGDELDNESRRVSSSSSASSTSTLQQSTPNHSRNVKFVQQQQSPNSHQPSKGILQSSKSSSFETMNQKSVSPLDSFAHIDLGEHYYQQPVSASAESPDNDSAFSDNVSCISSESGASRNDGVSCMSSGSSSKSSNGSLNAPSPTQTSTLSSDPSPSTATKSEKIKRALEKINETEIKKLFITVHFNEDLKKSFLIDERMTCLDICQSLAEKSETKLSADCAIVERLPELNIERFFEDHENLVENNLMWDKDSPNRLLYVKRKDKYDFITKPEDYLVGLACKDTEYDELARRTLVQDYFSSFAISPPELEAFLYLRNEAKKTWKKFWFVLRSSGLYYSTKAKSKASCDLECLTSFDVVNLFLGINWKKKHKAPTDYGFALKLPQIQSAKAVKNIKYVCCDDQHTLDLWMAGIRIAKYGRDLYDNFTKALERVSVMEEAEARASYNESFSSAQQTPVAARRLSSSDTAFDSDDLSTGTIKRKPPHSTTPKLPFTPKTSQILMRSADERRSFHSASSNRVNGVTGSDHHDMTNGHHYDAEFHSPTHARLTGIATAFPVPPPELLTSPTHEPNGHPLSPSLLRSPPPPTPPKPAALLQRKPNMTDRNDPHRHSIGPTPISSPVHSANNGSATAQLPFLHELRTKSASPLVVKKVLSSVPEIHDINLNSQPPSPVRRVNVSSPAPSSVSSSSSSSNGVLPGSPIRLTNGYCRTQSMSPTHKSKLPPPPPRRSDMTKLENGETVPGSNAVQYRMSEGNYERSLSLGPEIPNGVPQQKAVSSNLDFMADLKRAMARKKRHSLLLNESAETAPGSDYLPPPPPELLNEIRCLSPTSNCGSDDVVARKKPPPPPKRSDLTKVGGK
ncbi:hypothetical protein RvY_16494-2 [Ramazzottius varieornatus]|uniref:PH domain-containing protein n=1 Tax=Ramazzottius varieornatus TaxID=947166 RepID=A0A1D1W527_RAMVA|nr:hypothetical protein RvY_16494-2 [Ramazzottius varieornatus]